MSTHKPMSPELYSILSRIGTMGEHQSIRVLDQYLGTLRDVERKEQIESVSEDGNSLLHFAVHNNNCVKLAEHMITLGAPIERRDAKGNRPIHLAVDEARVPMCEMLLKHNASLEGENNEHETPLAIASRKNYTRLTEMLVRANADVNVYDKTGDTPLHNAALYGDKDMCELLIKHKADVFAVSKNTGTIPAMSARRNNHIALADWLEGVMEQKLDEIEREKAAKQREILDAQPPRPAEQVEADFTRATNNAYDQTVLKGLQKAPEREDAKWLDRMKNEVPPDQDKQSSFRNRP